MLPSTRPHPPHLHAHTHTHTHNPVCKGNLDSSVARLKKCRKWEEATAGISDEQCLEWMEDTQGADFISTCGRDSEGRISLFMHYASFDPATVKGEEGWTMMVKICLMMMASLAPDLDDVRRGSNWLCNCKGMYGCGISTHHTHNPQPPYTHAPP